MSGAKCDALIDGSVDVAPTARHLHVRLVDEPAVPDRVAARPRCIRQERREALNPPKHRHVIDLDAALDEEFFEVAIREAVAQVLTHREDDDLRREPEPLERRTRNCAHRTTTTRTHPATLTRHPAPPPTQQTRLPSITQRT